MIFFNMCKTDYCLAADLKKKTFWHQKKKKFNTSVLCNKHVSGTQLDRTSQ